jgi:hypothetical protein
MLANESFYDADERKPVQCNCDHCGKPTAFFYGYICGFKGIIADRYTVIYMSDAAYILCCDACLKEWVNKNVNKLNAECDRVIVEDSCIGKGDMV